MNTTIADSDTISLLCVCDLDTKKLIQSLILSRSLIPSCHPHSFTTIGSYVLNKIIIHPNTLFFKRKGNPPQPTVNVARMHKKSAFRWHKKRPVLLQTSLVRRRTGLTHHALALHLCFSTASRFSQLTRYSSVSASSQAPLLQDKSA